jgi:hypothetical protein
MGPCRCLEATANFLGRVGLMMAPLSDLDSLDMPENRPMLTLETLSWALQQPWTTIYRKGLALVLLYGATVHIGNIAGLTGTAWMTTPLLWRGMDVALLIFNLVAAIALWWGVVWSVGLVFGGILLLQIVPYTLWRSQFILQPEDARTLNGLLGTEILLLGLFALLLGLKK